MIEELSISKDHGILPDGRECIATLYRTAHRPGGRRIILTDQAGKVIYDTEDCYDMANAKSKLDDFALSLKAKEHTE